MTHPTEQDPQVIERDAALTALDMDWARRMMPAASSDEVLLVALHKGRYEVSGVAPSLREASRTWLEEHGWSRLDGIPWPPPGQLP